MLLKLRYFQFFILLFIATSWISDNDDLPLLEIRSTQITQHIVHPDGKSILLASGSQILIWDIYKKHILQHYHATTNSDVSTMSLSEDMAWIAAGYQNGQIVVWDANTFEVIHLMNAHTTAVTNIKIQSKSNIIVSGDEIGNVKTWDLTSAQMDKNLKAHDAAISAIDISANGQHLITASKDATAKLWDFSESDTPKTLVGHLSQINTACFLSDAVILTGSNDKTISAWNIQTGEIDHTLLGHKDNVVDILPLRGQDKFISTAFDGEIIIWDSRTLKETDRFELKNVNVKQMGIHKSNLYLLHPDNSISQWDLNEQKKGETIRIDDTPVLAGNVFNKSNFIIIGDKTGTIKKHELSNGDLIQHFSAHVKAITKIVKSPDGSTFATGAEDKVIKIWDSATCELLKTLEGHKASITALTYSQDGKFLYSGGKDKLIKWWNLSSGVEINSIKAHSDDITQLIPQEGTHLISVSKDRKIKIHDMEKGSLALEIDFHPAAILSAAYIPRDSLLYVGDQAGKISSYHIGQKIMVDQLSGHTAQVNSLCFTKDNTYLLSSSDDTTSNLWHLPSKNLENTFSGHTAPLSYCSFGKEETTIITASLDKQLKVWSIRELVQR